MKNQSWRDFEKMIADLERYIANDKVSVTSPDYVPELISGRMRQVDAAIRTTAGSAKVLITIECRKRKDRDDVTWIEQLITKRDQIGASRTIAVSSSGFTAGAKILAQQRGIDLRHINDVTVEAKQWLKVPKCHVPRIKYRVHSLVLVTQSGLNLRLSHDQLGFPITRNSSGAETPALTIINEFLFDRGLIRQFGEIDNPVTRVIKAKLLPGYNSINLNGSKLELLEVWLDITVQRYWVETVTKTELVSAVAYCNEDGQLARLETMGFELPFPLEGGRMEITYYANPEDDARVEAVASSSA